MTGTGKKKKKLKKKSLMHEDNCRKQIPKHIPFQQLKT